MRLFKPGLVAGLLALLASLTLACSTTKAPNSPLDLRVASARFTQPSFACAATSKAVGAPSVLVDGTALSFRQDPPVLTPGYDGPVHLLGFEVIGAVDEVSLSLENGGTRRSQRFTCTDVPCHDRIVAGQTVRGFDVQLPARWLAEAQRRSTIGHDAPFLHVADYEPAAGSTAPSVPIYLRFATLGIATHSVGHAEVVTLAPGTAQMTSHVVNLVHRDFGDKRIGDANLKAVEIEAVAKAFYDLGFGDEYDVIAIYPAEIHTPSFGGFHDVVRSDVEHIGLGIVDPPSALASFGELRAIQYYPRSDGLTHGAVNHELAHQWGHYLDWSSTSIAREGWEAGSHAPLLVGPGFSMGAVLEADVMVAPAGTCGTQGNTAYEICPSRRPFQFHPLTRWAMGHWTKDDLRRLGHGSFQIFEQQRQSFGGGTGAVSPDPGTPVAGPTVTVDLDTLLRDERQGTETRGAVRWATIVVSREKLISRAEMDYWTAAAQRLADPNRTGREGYRGHGSIWAASDGDVWLETHLTAPTGTNKPNPPHSNDYPPFPAQGWIDVQLDHEVPSRLNRSDTLVLQGRLVAADRSAFTTIVAELFSGRPGEPKYTIGPVSIAADGSFTLSSANSSLPNGIFQISLWLQHSSDDDQSRWAGAGWTPLRID